MQDTPENIIAFANKISRALRGKPTYNRYVTTRIIDTPANNNANIIKAAWLNGELSEPANDQEEAAIAEYLAS